MNTREITVAALCLAVVAPAIFSPSAGWGHGAGGHADESFTALSALQKGIALYDKLISSGKLDASWETRFAAAEVSRRTIEGRNEFVVKLSRAQGAPQAVYVFFDEEGEYRGSNFSGE